MAISTGDYLQPGTLIDGRYEVDRVLGVGGMGTVVLVTDRNLQRAKVVLKFLHHRLVPDQAQFTRFQNEVMIMREMMHPNIVKTYDIGQLGSGVYYISMEYVAGCSLGELLRDSENGKLPFDEALPILYEIAVGLAHAHSKGIIHRDLKPDNILISTEGAVKITDFGLAKAIELDMSLTEPGETVGTPYYMAPEQFRASGMDGRSDIYSFGVMAYELVVGERPFQSENFIDLAQLHFRQRIPNFTGRQSGVSGWFQDFVEKCAAKLPGQRFQSFYEVIEVLSCFVDSRAVSPLPPEISRSLSRRWRLVWWLSRPRRIMLFGSGFAFLLSLIILIAASRNNHPVRRWLLPPILRLESKIGIDSPLIRHLVAGREFKKITLLNPESIQYYMSDTTVEKIEICLMLGADPNGIDSRGQPHILSAVAFSAIDKFEILVEYGADLSVVNEAEQGVVTLAVLHPSPQILSAVLLNTPKELQRLDSRDRNGKTPLHYALLSRDVADIDQLINAGASLFVADSLDQTPLMYAVRSGSGRIVDRVLRAIGRENIDNVDREGRSALLIAAEGGDLEIIELMLPFSPMLDLKDNLGRTALMLAAAGGHTEICKELLRRNPSLIDIADNSGKRAVDYARNHPETLKILSSNISEL